MPVARTLLALALVGPLLAAVALPAQEWQGPCTAPDAKVRIDHVVTAVSDLNAASAAYRDLGFTLKQGRHHANGLLNRHVKFGDGTALELMTVDGSPTDAMARDYEAALHGGEGGVFLALSGREDAVLAAASSVGVAARSFREGPFGYVTFPGPGLRAVFVVRYATVVQDADSVFAHENGSTGIREVWVEGSEEFGEVLRSLGARSCGVKTLPDGREADAYGVGSAVVAVLPVRPGFRPRVVGVALAGPQVSGGRVAGVRIHGLHVALGPSR